MRAIALKGFHLRVASDVAMLATACMLLFPLQAAAQYFGKNTVRYETFDFKLLQTEHFDIYYYEESEETIGMVAKMAERWNTRLSSVLGHTLTRRQPIILYSSHPHFRQTNASPADIGEGTGGFTEIFRNRVVLPYAGTLEETDHVLGHELVHAFQFDMTGQRADREQFGNIPAAVRLPLWLVEGMAEYLSLGPSSAHTATWLRDLVVRDELPTRKRLSGPRFQPYRHGHALLAYIGGRWGDAAVKSFLLQAARSGSVEEGLRLALNVTTEDLMKQWSEDLRGHYAPLLEDAQPAREVGRILAAGRSKRGLPEINLAPSLSPDGTRLIYLSQRQRIALELYVMDVATGRVIRRITTTAVDPHHESLQFIRSAGDWSADGTRFAFATVRRGQPALTILDTRTWKTVAEIDFPGIAEIYNPAWSPDGRRIAFSGMLRGFTDLFVYDLPAAHLERLTQDTHSALQPAWSPDGESLVFVTDRFGSNLDMLEVEAHRLARIDVASRTIEPLASIPGASQIDPNWSADGRSIYFLSDARGAGNVYRLELASGAIHELTHVQTGINGLTALSPALSVAGPRDTLAFSLFDGGGYALVTIEDGAARAGTPLDEIRYTAQNALLPPLERTRQEVADYLARPEYGLRVDAVEQVRPYRARLSPEFISQVGIGAGTGQFGTYAGGGVSLYWSDMLGNHNLVTQLETAYVDGEITNYTAAAVAYQNRRRRFDWGGLASQIPLTSGAYGEAIVEVDGEAVLLEQAVQYWEINRDLAAQIAYPLSRAARLEGSVGFRNISFDAQERLRLTSLTTGRTLLDERADLPSPPDLNLGVASVAYVFDTSYFGGTSPVIGRRYRLQLSAVEGDLGYFSPLVDYRFYWMPLEEHPLTVAVRLLHFGRYGADSEDSRLRPLFLGSPSLVRGYESDIDLLADPVFDRMQGSRIATANVELRMPLTGSRGVLGGTYGPALGAALFYDVGAAWTRDEEPSFLGGDRSSIASYGSSLRLNLGGIVVMELSYVYPRDFPARGWHWQFNLSAGF